MKGRFSGTLLVALIGCGFAAAQTPDVRIRTDINLHYRSVTGSDSSLRWYDATGHHSIIAVEFGLEPGFRAYLAERLQKIDGNADNEQLDEYYVEDPGLWKIGKQYLPFGRQMVLRESARAARGDTNLIFERLPVAVAICDNGSGRTRGVIGRVGRRIGFSGAFGNNFGAQSTSLTVVRQPTDGPGVGRGYKLAVGADFAKTVGVVNIQGEIVGLRMGETAQDLDTEVSDLTFSFNKPKDWSVLVGWSREWRASYNIFRAQGTLRLSRSSWAEPIVRFREGRLYDAGISLRVRL